MLERARVVKAPVTVGDMDSVSEEILAAARNGRKGYVCVANVHMVTAARRDRRLMDVMERALAVTSDGMPLVWHLRRRGYGSARRVAGPDLMLRLCERASGEGIPIYFYGASDGVLEALKTALVERFPGLAVAGMQAPPEIAERPAFDPDTVARIQASGARLVFVGLGCPKQEFWMAAQTPRLASVLVGVGAAFDFLSGEKRRAPLWMQRRDLEWLFRLATEPGRLWHRYLITNSLFLYYLVVDGLCAAMSRPAKT